MDVLNLNENEMRERLVILTDMENEPDDSQTMVRLLAYANEIDIEGLIAVTSRWLQNDVFPESIQDRVHAYGIVRDNLTKHADNWPTADELLAVTAGGQIGYGMDAVGDDKMSDGAAIIIKAVDKDDPRPVNFAINAGANTLAQALWEVKRTRSPEEVAMFASKIKVFDDSGQDNAGAWIAHTFPDLFYARSRAQVFGLHGPTMNSGPYVWGDEGEYGWLERNIRTKHGVLGALYPQRMWMRPPWNQHHAEGDTEALDAVLHMFTEGGGTGSWLGLVNKGLFDPYNIHYGGWGGRYGRDKEHVSAGQRTVDATEAPYLPFEMYPQAKDTSWVHDDGDVAETNFSGVGGSVVYGNEDFAPIWRWRDASIRDFQARMDWCVDGPDEADHNPIVSLFGDEGRTILHVKAGAGELADFDASASRSPDGGELTYSWFFYHESGTYEGDLGDIAASGAKANFTVPADASGTEIHVILEVRSAGRQVDLTSYRRIVISVD